MTKTFLRAMSETDPEEYGRLWDEVNAYVREHMADVELKVFREKVRISLVVKGEMELSDETLDFLILTIGAIRENKSLVSEGRFITLLKYAVQKQMTNPDPELRFDAVELEQLLMPDNHEILQNLYNILTS